MTYKREFTGELDFANNPFSYPEPINQIYKFMPTNNNLDGELRDLFYTHWLGNSSNLFYTVRHDITAQIKSWALASITHRFHPYDPGLTNPKGAWQGFGDDARFRTIEEMNIDKYNRSNNTEFETIKDCQSHIDDTFDESLLLRYTDNIISTMQNQHKMYQEYKGTVCWLENRAETNNKRYPIVFSLPSYYDSWHCGSVGEQYFKE